MKNKEIYFVEKQKIPFWLHFIALVAGLEFLLFYILPHYFSQGTYLRYGIFALVELILILQCINTKIDNEGIFVKYYPFMLKYKFFSWEEIANIEIRQVKIFKEYGGYGIRIKIFSPKIYKFLGLKKSLFNDIAYVMGGKYGLQLELKNGKRILIGTRKPQEMEEILNNVVLTKQ